MDDDDGTGIYGTDFEIPRKIIVTIISGVVLGGFVLFLLLTK